MDIYDAIRSLLKHRISGAPVVENGVVFCMSGYKGYSLLALPLTARGDITGTDKILWRKNRGTPYIPSPVLYDGLLFYSQSNQALLTITDAKTGELIYALRIRGDSIRPKVFDSKSSYNLRIGEPDQNLWKTFENVAPEKTGDKSSLSVSF